MSILFKIVLVYQTLLPLEEIHLVNMQEVFITQLQIFLLDGKVEVTIIQALMHQVLFHTQVMMELLDQKEQLPHIVDIMLIIQDIFLVHRIILNLLLLIEEVIKVLVVYMVVQEALYLPQEHINLNHQLVHLLELLQVLWVE